MDNDDKQAAVYRPLDVDNSDCHLSAAVSKESSKLDELVIDEDLAAVRTAIDEWRAGDNGMPLQKAFDLVRLNHLKNEKPTQ